ncbi:uncharacterized protein SCHCODRAFT_02628150 [Schizophyllum commune H4-8]|uniref:uncharacterized protein n=1 Tax=Schizophyllum commune (strain H4-8 / FGSC 9210) TaxID=578458 RepID=UPI0021609E86|nr:uncharacterized protein SCHCODRAFT_02628150 [Schizophyllum commune H4-8]KAI5891112.1 hypothetical protein SCHCODRAFT_02628150 [Schizophyllum commune H4-8]
MTLSCSTGSEIHCVEDTYQFVHPVCACRLKAPHDIPPSGELHAGLSPRASVAAGSTIGALLLPLLLFPVRLLPFPPINLSFHPPPLPPVITHTHRHHPHASPH